jgi:N-acetylglucosaminyl-diphospho-decaprenol L-rhamnosyltransferase
VSVDVVVVDNASSDGSADVAEALGARLIRNDTNRWLSPAWNQGAAATRSPYLLFLNPDTE